MKITFSVRPIMMTGPTKNALIDAIKTRFGVVSYTIGTMGTFHRASNNDRVVFNLQKTRAKRKHTRNAHNKFVKSVIIRPASWTAYVYVFKVNFPATVHQLTRNFKVVPKNRAVSVYGQST